MTRPSSTHEYDWETDVRGRSGRRVQLLPSVVTAQTWRGPVLSAAKLRPPATPAGTVLDPVDPSPRWPKLLWPQQSAAASVVTPQLNWPVWTAASPQYMVFGDAAAVQTMDLKRMDWLAAHALTSVTLPNAQPQPPRARD